MGPGSPRRALNRSHHVIGPTAWATVNQRRELVPGPQACPWGIRRHAQNDGVFHWRWPLPEPVTDDRHT